VIPETKQKRVQLNKPVWNYPALLLSVVAWASTFLVIWGWLADRVSFDWLSIASLIFFYVIAMVSTAAARVDK